MDGIIYTRHDGGVDICWPSEECLVWLSSGGFWSSQEPGMADRQTEIHITSGKREWAVRRFIRSLQEGGCTTAEAYEIIRDQDCAHLGTGHELIAREDLPSRWFRDAWRRSHNGGPIGIDMAVARKIQLRRIKSAAEKHKADLALPRWRERIRRASSPEQIKQIWPSGLTLLNRKTGN